MTDKEKLNRVIAEIKRLQQKVINGATSGQYSSETIREKNQLLVNLLSFIDSMQVKQVDYGKLSNVERIGKDCKEEPVSEDLENEIKKIISDESNFMKFQIRSQLIEYIARHFANWQKEQMMAKGVDGVVHRFDGDGLAAIHYNDPKGVPMCYYTSPSGLEAGDKVKLILAKED